MVVLTGARQTGRTTHDSTRSTHLRYHILDDLTLRRTLRDPAAARWHEDMGTSMLGKAQQEPSVFEKVTFAFDAGDLDFTVPLGSGTRQHPRDTSSGDFVTTCC